MNIEMKNLDAENTEDTQKPLNIKMKGEIHKRSFLDKMRYMKSNITLEPVIVLCVMPSVMVTLGTQNLNLDKACRVSLNYSNDACVALQLRQLTNYKHEEVEVQKLMAFVQSWKSVVQTVFSVILMMFIGAWSDKTGRRKICIIMPILAEIMTSVSALFNTYFFYEVPLQYTAFMEVIFTAVTGGWLTLFLASYSYVGDITSVDIRTFRFGLISFCMMAGYAIGMGLSGVVVRYTGYYGVFGISTFILIINVAYVLIYIEDHRWLASKTEKQSKHNKCMKFLIEFFDFKSFKATIQLVLKQGENNRRFKICLVLLANSLTYGVTWGEACIMYIFTRYRFKWTEVEYSIYYTYWSIAITAGNLISVSVLSKKMKADDSILGITAVLGKMSACVLLAFASTTVEIYLVPLVEILSGTATIALRSLSSKLVSHQELGKVYSLFAISETMVLLMFSPMYSQLYIWTIHLLPGAVFLIGLIVLTPGLGVFIWFYRQQKMEVKENRRNAQKLLSAEVNIEE